MRLLDETGKQIGIVDRTEALKMAQAEEKDLVEIASRAVPPVVKLIDYKKFKYIESKKDREAGKAAKHGGFKQVRLSPFIGEHDFQTRIGKGEEFLKEGNQLKILVPFHGRELAHKEFGFQVLNKAIAALAEFGKVVRPPYFEGRVLVTILTPAKGSVE
jgi:translation initiation factor IF-3